MYEKGMRMEHVFFTILAGGAGERLWPLSRSHTPKQFLSLDHGHSLLEQTVDRLNGSVENAHIWIVSHHAFHEKIVSTVGNKITHILDEPCSRNTAAAALLTILTIHEQYPDSIVGFFPADHCITQTEQFRAAICSATTIARTTKTICLIGLQPTRIETGYGYIEYNNTPLNCNADTYYGVNRFHEKPSQQVAQMYVHMPEMLWNIGIAIGSTRTWIEQFLKYNPEIYTQVLKYIQGIGAYADIVSTSLDYALLEKSKNLYVLKGQFEWSDVGTLTTYIDHYKQNQTTKARIDLNSSNCTVYSPKKLVALMDIQDLCIIDTDDVLFITRVDKVQDIKKMVHNVKNISGEDYV